MMKLDVLYEDNHIIVIVKPANILSQLDDTADVDIQHYIKEYLKEKYDKPGNVYLGLVHRLDRRVSGVMVFARTSKAASRLSEQIRNHQFEKKYIAIATGNVNESGTLIDKIEKVKTRAVASNTGKEAVLNYQLVNQFKLDENLFSVLKVDLISGRYNQIRFQFANVKHPLINDYKYGYDLKNYNDQLGLCCFEIGFNHPITKEHLVFSKVPNEGIWENVRKDKL